MSFVAKEKSMAVSVTNIFEKTKKTQTVKKSQKPRGPDHQPVCSDIFTHFAK